MYIAYGFMGDKYKEIELESLDGMRKFQEWCDDNGFSLMGIRRKEED